MAKRLEKLHIVQERVMITVSEGAIDVWTIPCQFTDNCRLLMVFDREDVVRLGFGVSVHVLSRSCTLCCCVG